MPDPEIFRDPAAPAEGAPPTATPSGPAAGEPISAPSATAAGATGAPAGEPISAPSESAAGAPDAPVAVATRRMFVGVAALAILVTLGVLVEGELRVGALRSELTARLTDVDSGLQKAAQADAAAVAQFRAQEGRIALLETRLAEAQAQQAALETLYRDLAPSRDEIALTAIEQVLLIANQQLELARNVPSALVALTLADAKLQHLDRPKYLALRRALARDIEALKSVPFVDVAGMTARLDHALSEVDSLPLARDERVKPAVPAESMSADEPGWQRLLREFWMEIRGMVRVENTDRPLAPLVAPTEEYYLRENLRLRLLAARIAVLARDDAAAQVDLAEIDPWLARYFDTRSAVVRAVRESVGQISATRLPASIPDLARSLDALHALRLAQDRASGRPPERAAR